MAEKKKKDKPATRAELMAKYPELFIPAGEGDPLEDPYTQAAIQVMAKPPDDPSHLKPDYVRTYASPYGNPYQIAPGVEFPPVARASGDTESKPQAEPRKEPRSKAAPHEKILQDLVTYFGPDAINAYKIGPGVEFPPTATAKRPGPLGIAGEIRPGTPPTERPVTPKTTSTASKAQEKPQGIPSSMKALIGMAGALALLASQKGGDRGGTAQPQRTEGAGSLERAQPQIVQQPLGQRVMRGAGVAAQTYAQRSMAEKQQEEDRAMQQAELDRQVKLDELEAKRGLIETMLKAGDLPYDEAIKAWETGNIRGLQPRPSVSTGDSFLDSILEDKSRPPWLSGETIDAAVQAKKGLGSIQAVIDSYEKDRLKGIQEKDESGGEWTGAGAVSRIISMVSRGRVAPPESWSVVPLADQITMAKSALEIQRQATIKALGSLAQDAIYSQDPEVAAQGSDLAAELMEAHKARELELTKQIEMYQSMELEVLKTESGEEAVAEAERTGRPTEEEYIAMAQEFLHEWPVHENTGQEYTKNEIKQILEADGFVTTYKGWKHIQRVIDAHEAGYSPSIKR